MFPECSGKQKLLAGKLSLSLTVLHELSDDVDGFLRDHSEEAHESWVLQVLHQVSLGQKGSDRHGACFQTLNGHSPVIIVQTWVGWTEVKSIF